MDLQGALSLLREIGGIHATAIEAFGTTCSGIWTADCTLGDFASLVCDELPAFLSRCPPGYTRPSSFDRVYAALRALFKSDRVRAELGEEATQRVLATLKASWRSALDAEIRRRAYGGESIEAADEAEEAADEAEEAEEDPEDPEDQEEEDEYEAEEAEYEAEEAAVAEEYESTVPCSSSRHRIERVKSLFAEYVLAGTDCVKQRAVVARLIEMM
jgi:hypothetical protein